MPLILPGNVATATAAVGYTVANSCRFNDGDSAYVHKSPASEGNRDTMTFSFWVKRGVISNQGIFNHYTDGNNYVECRIDGSHQLEFINVDGGATTWRLVTNRLFRDPSAWYHIVVALDSSDGTADDRQKIYVNGTQETSFASRTNPDEDQNCKWNNANQNTIGTGVGGSYFDGYLAEFVFIDGLQLAATSFGEFDEDSPTIWKPIDVSGLTFGTNGFYLDFESSGNLGNDANGGTDLTEVNLAATDQATDSPTNNFATWNSVIKTTAALAEGNLHYTTPGSNPVFGSLSTIGVTAGKWYGELNYTSGSEHKLVLGVADDNFNNGLTDASYDIGKSSTADSIAYVVNTGAYRINNSNTSWGSGGGDGNIINWAIDRDNGKLYFGVDNTWGNSSDPAAGSNGIPTTALDSSAAWFFGITSDTSGTGDVGEINFGNPSYANTSDAADANGYGAFEFAPPSGYYALCTKNLAEFG